LALTDGNGLNLKLRGKFDFSGIYLVDEPPGTRKATPDDFLRFPEMVTEFLIKCAASADFAAQLISSYQGRKMDVLYQTWLIEPSDERGRQHLVICQR
jgi:hypothetical protein